MLAVLGVSGGIAAYKACEVVRGLDRAGLDVQVVMTANATRFIAPLTLQTLSRRTVLLDPFALDDPRTIRHVDLAREAAVLVVAPATANVLAKLAHGVADDLLTAFALAVTSPIVVAPAMNTRMWLHPATQENLATLRRRGVELVDPETGWLAEDEVGWGRLAAPERIVAATLAAARRSSALAGKRVVVTAGPTREPIDPVRFLSNRSSGRMGFALAAAAAARGAEVVLIAGPVALATPWGVRRVDVETATEMQAALAEWRPGAEAVFMAAAVADYAPAAAATKLKKTGTARTLTLDEGPDLLAELGADRRERVLVGFAAETEDLVAHAQAKLERKRLDFIVANDVSAVRREEGVGIDATDNAVTILGRNGNRLDLPRAAKREIAERILDHVLGTRGPQS